MLTPSRSLAGDLARRILLEDTSNGTRDDHRDDDESAHTSAVIG